MEQAIRQSKRADLFEEGHDSYMRASLLQKEPEIENTRFYFNFIFQNVQQFLKEFHSHQTYLVILSSIFFSIIVIVLYKNNI